MRPNKTVSWGIASQLENSYLCVVFFPSLRLVYVNLSKKQSSSGHQAHVKDSVYLICSLGERSRSNGSVRRPSAPACNTIHLRGGVLQSISAFFSFLPPLNAKTWHLNHQVDRWMYLHIWMCAHKPDFQSLWILYRYLVHTLQAVNLIAWGYIFGNFPLFYRGWFIAPFRGSMGSTWRILVIWICTSGWTSISVLRQELDPSLVERQRMMEEADMFHALLSMCNPDGRDSIPETLVMSAQGYIKAEYVLHTRHQRNALVHLCMKSPAWNAQRSSSRSLALSAAIQLESLRMIPHHFFGSTYSLFALKIKIDYCWIIRYGIFERTMGSASHSPHGSAWPRFFHAHNCLTTSDMHPILYAQNSWMRNEVKEKQDIQSDHSAHHAIAKSILWERTCR